MSSDGLPARDIVQRLGLCWRWCWGDVGVQVKGWDLLNEGPNTERRGVTVEEADASRHGIRTLTVRPRVPFPGHKRDRRCPVSR